MIYVCSVTPAVIYFHKHRKVLLSGGFFTKSTSYYDPKRANMLGASSYNKGHHLKEMGARLFIGFIAGYFSSLYFFGVKKLEDVVDYETQEALED